METLMNSVHEMLEADRLDAMEHQHELESLRASQTHAEQEGAQGPAGVGGPGGER
jgi:osmoprotectant transport system ATP-binding protein